MKRSRLPPSQPMQPGRRVVTQHGSRSTGEDGRKASAVLRQIRMPYGVDAAVDRVPAPLQDTPVNLIPAVPKPFQLPYRHNAVLAFGQGGESPVPPHLGVWLSFVVHNTTKLN